MQKSWSCLLFIACLILAVSTPSRAGDEGITNLGPLVGLSLGPDQILLGGFVDFGTMASPIRIIGFADIGFGDDLTTFAAGPSFVATVPIEGLGQFYGGIFLGLNHVRLSDDHAGKKKSRSNTDLGIAADFGMIFPVDRNSLRLDLKVNLENHSDMKLLIGYQIGLD